MNHTPRRARQPGFETVVQIGEVLVIETEQMQDGGVKVVDVNGIHRRPQSEIIRRAMGVAGTLVQTPGITSLPSATQSAIREKVETYDAFTPDNDPYGEHDFGSFEQEGAGRIFWKIDYYDHSLQWGSENPADPSCTRRVLTIMLAEEY